MMMESNEVSSQEKLDWMLSEGKITQEDYDLLLRSMEHGQEKPSHKNEAVFSDIATRLPWQVWTCIGMLVFACLFQVPYFMHRHPMRSLAILAVTVPLVYGLYHLHRWAFIVCISSSFFAVVTLGSKNSWAALLNTIFGVILLTAYPYFFHKDNENKGGL